jgi:hypothetical protein
VDNSFGKLFGMSSYSAGLSFLGDCGPVDNDDLGGALLELPLEASPQGTYTAPAVAPDGGRNFSVDITVNPLP